MPNKLKKSLIFLSLPLIIYHAGIAVFSRGWIEGRLGISYTLAVCFLFAPIFYWYSSASRPAARYIGSITCLLLIGLGVVISLVELFHFDNYLFSAYHLDPEGVLGLIGLLVGIVLFAVFYTVKKEIVILGLLLSMMVIPNAVRFISVSIYKIWYVSSNLNLSISEKYKLEFGKEYDFYSLINKSVMSNARILIPPEKIPWRHSGNSPFMRSLLFPRDVQSVTLAPKNWVPEDYDYILISSEEYSGHVQLWPNFSIPAKYILIYNWSLNSWNRLDIDIYNPIMFGNTKPWGLIVTKKQS